MENVSYFTPPAIGDYGKRRIFHALDNLNTIKDNKTAQQQRQPWPPAIGDYGKRCIFDALDNLNIIKYDKTAQLQRQPCRFPKQEALFQQKNKYLLYFPVPNHSVKNTHILWKT